MVTLIEETARILKALGEPTRLKIIKLLSERELCICELVAVLDMSQPRISQHVKVLRQAGILTERKSRQNSYLKINKEILNGTIIEPLSLLMQVDLIKIEDFQDEYNRYITLDRNEDVIACKTKNGI